MSDNRSHIDEKYQWDLSTVFATDDAWESELANLDSDLENAKAYKGRLTASSNDLLAITESYLALSRRLEKLYVYASMKNDQDTTVAKYQEYQAKATAIYAKFSEIFAFYEPELMQLSKEAFEDFVAETPALSAYAHFFEQLFKRQPHVLSQAEEELLAGAQEIFGAAGETFGLLDNADIIFPIVLDDEGKEIQLTHGNFISLLESKNRDVRKEAYQALYATYEQFQHTYAKTLQTNVKVHNYEARVHHFKSAREAALSANFIPESVYDTLIETVNANLPLLHRYVELRKKILKLDDLKMYDIHTPLSEMDMSFTYEEALAKAEDVLAVFGKEILNLLQGNLQLEPRPFQLIGKQLGLSEEQVISRLQQLKAEIGTNERLLRSDVTLEESRKIERVLRRNNISYFEKWNFHTGVFKFLNNSKNSKCDIYVHMDSMDKAKELLADM